MSEIVRFPAVIETVGFALVEVEGVEGVDPMNAKNASFDENDCPLYEPLWQ